MKTVIMAGGLGKRIKEINDSIPKPLIMVNGKPVLEREIECLSKQGFKDIIITVSYMKEKIIDHFKDGKDFGVNIEYFIEEEPLGNAGALFELKDKLTDDFLLINADSIFDIDLNRFVNFHYQHKGLASLFVHPNNHPYDSGLIILDDNNQVIEWLNKEEDRPKWYRNIVNAGMHILSPELLNNRPDTTKVDLDRQILKPLANKNLLYAYKSSEYIKDMGTPERYKQVRDDFGNNLPFKRNLVNKQKAIFLDRDGTINKYKGFLNNIDDFELIDDIAENIKKINSSEYLCIVVSNQPVIARGELSFDGLDEIHKKMETLLGLKGAYIDGLYYCPHHPDSGFEGEIKELKIDCDCRKPKPGMLIKASKDFNIDLSKSYMIGDSDNDIKAGNAADCKSYKINSDDSISNIIREILTTNL